MCVRSICLREKGAHRYNRYTASGVRSQGPNFTQQFKPVHTRHFYVGQYQIWKRMFYQLEALSFAFLAGEGWRLPSAREAKKAEVSCAPSNAIGTRRKPSNSSSVVL
jgi:hypothetical protein